MPSRFLAGHRLLPQLTRAPHLLAVRNRSLDPFLHKFPAQRRVLTITKVIGLTVSVFTSPHPPSVLACKFRMFCSYCSLACATSVKVELAFGGKTWTIDPADFMLTQLSQDTCLGAFFELQMSGSAPAWIIGDTFLVQTLRSAAVHPD